MWHLLRVEDRHRRCSMIEQHSAAVNSLGGSQRPVRPGMPASMQMRRRTAAVIPPHAEDEWYKAAPPIELCMAPVKLSVFLIAFIGIAFIGAPRLKCATMPWRPYKEIAVAPYSGAQSPLRANTTAWDEPYPRPGAEEFRMRELLQCTAAQISRRSQHRGQWRERPTSRSY